MKQDLRSRVADEIANGRVWRAKEILRGSFSGDFDPDRCEAYGQILLQMNDLKEAGRYLFVSGARKPEYQDAIAIFMEKFATMKARNRLLSLPARIHRVDIDDWPASVIEDLKRLEVFEEIRNYQQDHAPPATSRRVMNFLVPFGCITTIALISLLAATGLLSLLSMLLGYPLF
jgi:Family of unknown function (DUF6584)